MSNKFDILYLNKQEVIDLFRPLVMNASPNNIEVVKYLVMNGADINAINNNGWSSTAIAESNGNKSVVDFFNKVTPRKDNPSGNVQQNAPRRNVYGSSDGGYSASSIGKLIRWSGTLDQTGLGYRTQQKARQIEESKRAVNTQSQDANTGIVVPDVRAIGNKIVAYDWSTGYSFDVKVIDARKGRYYDWHTGQYHDVDLPPSYRHRDGFSQ